MPRGYTAHKADKFKTKDVEKADLVNKTRASRFSGADSESSMGVNKNPKGNDRSPENQHVMFVCLGLTSLSTLSVISRRCLVVTGSSMLTFIVLPHCGIRSQTLLPDTTPSHIILIPERPVLALP